ncbi:MAG: electron transfer flavoprotein subunit beta/FixA family protein [Planctomycetaceae bacterium]|nr:electron transfer flavoprotein subunit beta/FixA family protein [Planctomycetaceae bacterium]
MKIVATLKRTPQRDTRMKLTPEGALVVDQVQYEVNPFDELAVEEALVIRDKFGGEVIALAVGPAGVAEQLQTALAMGADRSVRVETDQPLDPLQTAHALAAAVRKESPDLVLMGKLAIDAENGQVPLMLAELLGWPHASFASKVEVAADQKSARVTCEVDGGLEIVEVTLPAIITTDLRLNEPRYASLPGILKAKKKPAAVIPLAEVGELPAPSVSVAAYRTLPPRQKGEVVGSAEELAEKLLTKKLV